MIEELAAAIPLSVRSESGKAFYSGRLAFARPSDIYVLGLNPGGEPNACPTDTVEYHTQKVLNEVGLDWSAYRDESWNGAIPGTLGMAPRMMHLFHRLGKAPGEIPCSNLIFARSSRESTLANPINRANECWPVHQLAIEFLKPKVIICLGKTVGNYIKHKVGVGRLEAEFVEQNDRGWRSQIFRGDCRIKVAVLTHPSIADWTSIASDPTSIVHDALLSM